MWEKDSFAISFPIPCFEKDSSEFKTPLSLQPIHTMNSTRVTPPLCECGRRCKRKQVINPGPNIGRIFYSCSLQSPKDKSNGCRYFKWEAQKSIDHGGTDNQVLDRRAALKEKCMKLYNCWYINISRTYALPYILHDRCLDIFWQWKLG